MEQNTPATSFIPKQQVVTSAPERVKRPLGLLTFFSIVVLILSVVALGIVYMSKQNLEREVGTYVDSIATSKERFEEGLSISLLQQFDTRLRAGDIVLKSHKTLIPFFTLLNKITLKNVQFTNMTLETPENSSAVNVKLSGRAPNYKTIAEQGEIFSRDPEARSFFTNLVFSNLAIDESSIYAGTVTFDLVFSVEPSFLSFTRMLSENNKSTSTPLSTGSTNTQSGARINPQLVAPTQ